MTELKRQGGRKGKELTVVIRIRPEEMPEQVCIPRCVTGPHVPNFIAQRIGYEFILWAFHYVVRTHVGGLSIGVICGIEFLGREKTEMLTPEKPAEGGRMVSCFIGLAIHGAVEEFLVFHDDGEFAVVDAKLGLR